MAQAKPIDLNKVWAETGGVTNPGDAKISLGYIAEIPTFQDTNWFNNLISAYVAHSNQQGISVWDTITIYPIDALVKGSDGNIYKAILEQSGNDPVSSPPSVWILALTNFAETKSGRKNLILNPKFNINQNAVSGTVILLAGEYEAHDRWRGGPSGCTYTFSVSAGLTTIDISVGSLEQVIDGSTIEALDAILSWEGTAQGQINGGGFGTTGNVKDNILGGASATVEFGTGTLTNIQLEEGDISTALEFRDDQAELALCQPYNQYISFNKTDFYTVASVYNIAESYSNIVNMRTTPTFSIDLITNINPSVAVVNAGASTAFIDRFLIVYGTAGATGEFTCSGRIRMLAEL